MEYLRAPWRHAYVTSTSGGTTGCIFCQASQRRVRLPVSAPAIIDGAPVRPCRSAEREGRQPDPPCDELILVRGRVSYVILNLYPYNNGHVMVVPDRHAPNLASMSVEEQAELMKLTRHAEIALTEAYAPHGINVGINMGKPAGAGVLDHLHVHLVPRWDGDTNFMTVVGNVRVLPEDLSETAKKLRPIFERLANEEETAERAKVAEKKK